MLFVLALQSKKHFADIYSCSATLSGSCSPESERFCHHEVGGDRVIINKVYSQRCALQTNIGLRMGGESAMYLLNYLQCEKCHNKCF